MTEKQEKIENLIIDMVRDLSSFYNVDLPKVTFIDTFIGGVDIGGRPISGEYVHSTHAISLSRPALEHKRTFEWYTAALHEYRHFLHDMVIERTTGRSSNVMYRWKNSMLDSPIMFRLDAKDQSFILRGVTEMYDYLEDDAEAWASEIVIKLYKRQYPELKVAPRGYPTSLQPITDIVSPVWDEILKIEEKVKKMVYHPKLVKK